MIKFALGAAIVAIAMSGAALSTPSQAGLLTAKPNCTRGIIGCRVVHAPKPKCTRGIIGCKFVLSEKPKCTRGIIGCR